MSIKILRMNPSYYNGRTEHPKPKEMWFGIHYLIYTRQNTVHLPFLSLCFPRTDFPYFVLRILWQSQKNLPTQARSFGQCDTNTKTLSRSVAISLHTLRHTKARIKPLTCSAQGVWYVLWRRKGDIMRRYYISDCKTGRIHTVVSSLDDGEALDAISGRCDEPGPWMMCESTARQDVQFRAYVREWKRKRANKPLVSCAIAI